MKVIILALATLVIGSIATANDSFSAKDVGFLLNVASATDTTGTPIASYLQKMNQLGDKWDTINQSLGDQHSDGTYEDNYQIVNNGCGVTGHSADCKVATLTVKVIGKIGAAAQYVTTYTEAAGN